MPHWNYGFDIIQMNLLSVFMHVIVISMWTNQISKPYLSWYDEETSAKVLILNMKLTYFSCFPPEIGNFASSTVEKQPVDQQVSNLYTTNINGSC